VKRVFDFAAAMITMVLFFPILITVCACSAIAFRGRVLFTQPRPGIGGRPFKMVKFRSMIDARGPDGELLPDGERLTRYGRFLRATSLDELPALWNVITGDMSLVGPRPLLVEYLVLYTAEQARRHEVRPGITGWAQVNGRNLIGWDERFALDVWYVDHRTFLLDLKILFLTVQKVLARHGISAKGEATAHKFTGKVP
jgi:sugar transferase EpsL